MWTAPPPAWNQTTTGKNLADIQTAVYQVRNGSTNVILRWNYTLLPGQTLLLTTFSIGDGISQDDIGLVIGGPTGTPNNKYKDLFSIYSTSLFSNLTISRVSEEERATFQCTLQVGGDIWAYNIRIEVTDPADITQISGNQTVNENEEVTLNCSAKGTPTPNISWTRVSDNSSVSFPLTITGKQDEGGYRCIADNGIGNPASQVVYVIAESYHPIDTILKSSLINNAVVVNESFNITCSSEANPPAEYRFYKNLDNFVNDTTGSDVSVITTSVSERRKQVTYSCTPFNKFGDGLTDGLTLTVLYAPGSTTLTTVPRNSTLSRDSIMSLNCETNASPEAEYHFYFNGKSIGNGTSGVFNVTVEADGVYTCVPINAVGTGDNGSVSITVVETSVPTTVTTSSKPTTKATEECKCSCNDVILAAVVGVLVFIIIGLILYIVWLHKKGTAGKQRHYKEERDVYDNEMALDDLQPSSHIPSKSTQSRSEYMDITEATADIEETRRVAQSTDYAPLHPSTRSWEVEKQHVTIEKVIGKGAFGQVAKGTAAGLLGRPGKTTVAVKMLKYNSPESDRRDLLTELDTMKQLKPHPHVIKLLGCVTETEPLMVIIEYVPYGDLLGYLRKSRGLNDTYYKDPDVKPQTSLTSQQLMKFAWQIADGMSYLSSKSIIHRDLAARNVLVGERETCKVTDFGMARDVQQDNIYEKKTKGRLPVKWTAYEALLYGTYTTKSDIWSYGVVLYEIFTIGGSPYPRVNGKRIASLLQEGYRMPKPQHVDDKLYEIMLKCWQNDPDVRPTFSELKNQLKDMENQHKRLINLKMYDHNQLYAIVEDLVE